jgi:uncharacterized protein (TIGR02453 family)
MGNHTHGGIMSGTCFTPDLFEFLSELEDNNNRDWFQANKPRYERHVKGDALAFIRAFEQPLHAVSPHFRAIPKAVGGSLFRIYRDVRFSKDKSPYKTHTGVHFRHAAAKDAHAPGFYLHLAPGEVFGAFGVWMPPNPVLNKIRDAIVARADEWADIQQGLAVASMPCHVGDGLKRVPRGYDKEHPHAEALKRKSHAATHAFTPEQATQPDFMDRYAASCQQAAPLMRFICDAVGVPF